MQKRSIAALVAVAALGMGLGNLMTSDAAVVTPGFYTVEQGDTYRTIATRFGLNETALSCANRLTASSCPSVTTALGAGRIIFLTPATAPTTTTTTVASSTTVAATTTTSTVAATTTLPSGGQAFTENFSGPLSTARFTAAHWRDEEAGQLDPTINGSKILTENGTLRIESGEQNYGDSAVRINQPFDFAGRTGTIAFDVSLDAKDGWTRFSLSQDPYAVTSYGDDNAAGQGPDRGIDLQFHLFAGCADVALRTYANRSETDLDGPQFPQPCVAGSASTLTHVTVSISNTSVMVMSGQTMLGSWTGLNLGFSRGYIYLDSHNHATIKYANQPTWITHWDNVTFDGPVLAAINVSSAATIEGRSLAGLPSNPLLPRLIFNAQHGQQDNNVTLNYSLNGNGQHTVPLQRLPGLIGVYMLSLPVNTAELVAGTNNVAFSWLGTTGLPPRVADVQLVWGGSSGPPPTTTIPASTTSTTTAGTTTTSSTIPTTTTTISPGTGFSEDFASATALSTRFDHGWSGEWNAGALFNDSANDWEADHDMTCGEPNGTHRTIHLSSQQQANDAAFFPCTFAGDAAKSHMMTTVNTEGYVTVWFAPKQTFNNVTRVCWDQNINWQGGGKWVIVNFLTPAEYSGQTDLGYTSPDFPPANGPSSPQGDAKNGVKVFAGGMDSYTNGVFHGGPDGIGSQQSPYADKAPRYQHCVFDNNNGTLTLAMKQPNGTTLSQTVPGNIPDGPIKVEFADDNYNPDKHFYNPQQDVPRDSTGLYTWHWDNLVIA